VGGWGALGGLAIAPDGQRIAYISTDGEGSVSPGNRTSPQYIWLKPVSGGAATRLPIQRPAFLDDLPDSGRARSDTKLDGDSGWCAVTKTKILKLEHVGTEGKVRSALVTVPQPCSVPWDSMTGTEQARTCSICDRQVHDLSMMSTSEAERVLGGRNRDRLCIRMEHDAHGRAITIDRQVPYFRRTFTGISIAAPAAFLGLAEPRPVFAFLSRPAQDISDGQSASATRHGSKKRDASLSGTIRDTTGEGLPEATVAAINEQNGEAFSIQTGADGRYHIALPRGTYLVSVKYPILTTYAVRGFRIRSNAALNVTLDFPCMGECIVLPPKNFQTRAMEVLGAPFRAVKKLMGS